MKPERLNFKEAALYLGRGERFLRRLVFERRIRYYKVGKFLSFERADLDAFLKAEVVEPVGVAWRGGRAVAA
jgi:excisionase family DNA binding protein